MIGLLLPAALGLLALAAAPLMIHWLSRRRATLRAFPALILLTGDPAGRSQRNRLREWLVLALRCLAIAAAVLAVAGLVWRGSLTGSADRPLVIIVDASASMQQIDRGATTWSRAQAAADALLDRAGGRPLAVLIAGDLPQPPPGLSADPGDARTLLAEARPGWGDGSVAGSLAVAAELLAEAGGDCYLISDLARSSLAGVDPAALPEGLRLHLVDVGGGGANVGIVGIGQRPGQAIAGEPVTVLTKVANYSAAERSVGVVIGIGDADHVEQVVLPPGGSQTLTHTITADSSGALPVQVRLTGSGGDDHLAADDHRFGALRVRPGLRSLVVSDRGAGDAAGAVRPLLAALEAARLAPRLSDAAGLADLDRSDPPDLVVTADLQAAPDAGLARLGRLVSDGGAWLQVVSSAADAELGLPDQPPPVAFGEAIDVSTQEAGAMPVQQARLDHALLGAFRGREQLLTRVAAYRYRLTPMGQAADAAVLWAYGDGSIALAERPVGRGRWLQLNCSPAAADGNLGSLPVLPLLLDQLPAAILPVQQPDLASAAGAILASAEAWEGPDGLPVPSIDGRVRFIRPGIYRQSGGMLQAIATPSLESDLRRIDPAVLGLQADSADSVLQANREQGLWSWALALAAAALLAELLLAGGGGLLPRRRGGQP